MRVFVEVYGLLRDRAGGQAKMEMDVEEGTTVAELVTSLGVSDGDPWIASIGSSLANDNTPLVDGCRLVVIPPMDGGEIG